MNKVHVINTGGTFSKVYDEVMGTLDVPIPNFSVETIIEQAFKHNSDIIDITHIINKDSLNFDNGDRKKLFKTIKKSKIDRIIVIHGTDTMDKSINHLLKNIIPIFNKTIVFTGAMKPFSIDQVEATSNLSVAYGFIQACPEPNIYISMNGLIKHHSQIKKDKTVGQFV